MLKHPMQDLESWVQFFSNSELPVLRHTKRQLEEARANIQHVSGRDITRIVLHDPLMVVKVLAYIQPFRSRRLSHDITTIASAVMMLGIEPFFAHFDKLVTIEDMLKDENSQALLGALNVIRRSQRAARYAHEWGIWRHDVNVEEVTVAAVLHDLAEVLLWCLAPHLALDIRGLQQADANLRSAVAQERILGVRLQDIQLGLCHIWHLPELLVDLIDDSKDGHPRVRNVSLAVKLARHSATSWQDAALPDDYKDIADLLHLSLDALKNKLGLDKETPPEPSQGL
ncbi:MAG: hypothetical protein RIR00_2473 [Pseudomonadota bacterium]|jgi:HD-like signal output (HDOD) protein